MIPRPTLLAAAGGSAITLGVLAADAYAIARPYPETPTPSVDLQALAAQLEGWAADLRRNGGKAVTPILGLDGDDTYGLTERLAEKYTAPSQA
jgi:hypothetical protein